MTYYVYILANKTNSTVYIGMTNDFIADGNISYSVIS